MGVAHKQLDCKQMVHGYEPAGSNRRGFVHILAYLQTEIPLINGHCCTYAADYSLHKYQKEAGRDYDVVSRSQTAFLLFVLGRGHKRKKAVWPLETN